MMPETLILLRHGQSYGNWVNDMIRANRYREIPSHLYGVPIWLLRLTQLGVEQAICASEWLDQNIGLKSITAAFHSPFVRAIETASHIKIPGLIWRENATIRERSWGDMDHVPTPKEYDLYRTAKIGKSSDLSWLPPNGEELMSLGDRLTHLYGTLHRQHTKDTVICVMHGEAITAMKMDLERIHRVRANDMIARKDPILWIPNCGITQYTRINPITGTVQDHLNWVREIDPMNSQINPSQLWREIKHEKLSCDDLAQLVTTYGIGQ